MRMATDTSQCCDLPVYRSSVAGRDFGSTIASVSSVQRTIHGPTPGVNTLEDP